MNDQLCLEHESQRVVEVMGLELCICGAFKGFCIRTVPGHAVVKACSAGHKTLRFCIVGAKD